MSATSVRISEVRTRAAEGGAGPHDVAECSVRVGDRSHEIWMQVTGAPLVASPEPFFAATLQPAMSLGADIECGPLSGRLLDALPELQARYACFDRGLRPVAVEAARAAPRSRADGVGLCFSLGVDGMYSLVAHADTVTHLVLIHGIDYPRDAPFRAQVSAAARRVAERTGKVLVEVDGTLHEFVRQFRLSTAMTPGQAALGAMLSAVGYLIRDTIGTLLIPSSATARTLLPFGSHPLIDPLWSSEDLEIVHDAIAVERIDKVRAFADFEPAFDTLRPCGTEGYELYNCGRCRKCAYTMLMLEAAGALDRFTVFPTTLEEALEAADATLRFKVSPGMWFESMQLAIERLEPDSPAAQRMKKFMRSSTFFGRLHRTQSRRRMHRLFVRVARRARRGRG